LIYTQLVPKAHEPGHYGISFSLFSVPGLVSELNVCAFYYRFLCLTISVLLPLILDVFFYMYTSLGNINQWHWLGNPFSINANQVW